MTLLTVPRALSTLTFAAGLALLAGCSTHTPGDLGRLQQLQELCPKDQLVNAYVATDGSGTSNSATIVDMRLDTIQTVVERVAVCGGHLTIVAFGTNSVPALIYDADMQIDGATDVARLRQVPEHVERIMTQVAINYRPAVAALPAGGTDVTGLYRLLGEVQSLREDMRLEAVVLTDGLTNQGVAIDHALSAEDAMALADSVTVSELPGASVSVIGVGRVAGDPLPSEFIEGMKAFYTRLCEKTQAAQCLVVTDGE